MSGGEMHPADEDRLLAAREDELVARLKATRARIELLAGLVAFTEARWPALLADERRRDPCAPDATIAARAHDRVQAELKERGLDD